MVAVHIGAARRIAVSYLNPEVVMGYTAKVHQHRVHRQNQGRVDEDACQHQNARSTVHESQDKEEDRDVRESLQQGNPRSIWLHGQRHQLLLDANFARECMDSSRLGR